MNWKKHGLQLVSLALNVVLLIILLQQNGRLERLEAAVENTANSAANDLGLLRNQVDGLQTQLREGEKLIADYSLEPTGLDMEAHALLADVALQLKEWAPDSAVALTVSIGGNEAIQDLDVDDTGACRGQLSATSENQRLWKSSPP